ncbi:MAG: IPT/TIG domain-containing protein [Geobacter sp.]|nr:IPT/TIG domain-containing protein [Geobacter sp.]
MRFRFFLAFFILMTVYSDFACGVAKKGLQTKNTTPKTLQQKASKAESLSAITILSMIPAQGEPGTAVTLYGTGFSDQTVAYLGSREVQTRVLGPQQLTFDIPQLRAGLYTLFLKREDGSTSKTYNFTILPPKPVANSLSPDRLHACARGQGREITIFGRNFQANSQVMFNGAVIRSQLLTGDTIAFSVPHVAGGLHQVQVRNPEDTTSSSLGLYIDSRPEIDRVYRDEEFVNYYNLVIDGKNFQQGGTLIVEDKTLNHGGNAIHEGKRLTIGTGAAIERDRVLFVDCTKLVYQRYPYDYSAKDFRLQVVNPDGEGSAVIQVSAP